MKNKAPVLLFLYLTIISTIPLMSKDFPSKTTTTVKNEISRPQYMPGQIRVKFKQQIADMKLLKDSMTMTGIALLDEKLARLGIQSIEKSFKHRRIPKDSEIPDISRIYTLCFADDKDVQEVAKSFARDPNIEYAEPILINYIEVVPDDPQFSQQNHLTQIHMPEAWDIQKGDSTVIIAIVDNGTDYHHPDLVANVWTNELEAEGLAGVDDDKNGYVDDIHGWDFAEQDNNPTNAPRDNDGYWSHGTCTTGLASAVTNNNIGIAGVSWNCKFMPIKSSYDNNPGNVTFGYQGIIYAADNGADIISLSWGGFGNYFQSGQDIINYAYGKGSLIVAAAGNINTNDFHYPSAFTNVLSVTWVNFNDILSSYGSYGISVDLCAPGIGILSTIPYKDGAYDRAGGSSMACPIVAGLCGLVKSQHPKWSNDQIVRQVVLTADNIDYLNPTFAGQIGSGRVNGYRAVSEANPTDIAPRIKSLGISFSDFVGGDNDHILERGETIEITAGYRNFSVSPGFNVVFTLTSNDTDLTMTNGVVSYGVFAPDTTISMPVPFSFTVNNNARGKTAQIFVGWQADGGYTGADTFKVIVGKIPIIVVDDDRADYPAEKMYTNILDWLNLDYAPWDRTALGPLGTEQITNFPIVIWLCEWAFPSLDTDDQTALANFLDKGGSLFITGQDIGWDFNDPGGYGYPQRDFYANYLHAVYYADDSEVNDVIGIAGDPIGDGFQFKAWQPGLTADDQFPDEIEPGPGATTVFEYAGGKNHKFGIKYKGNHKIVYFGMGLEAIDSQQNTSSDDLSPIRSEVLGRILNWLNFIEHTPLTDTENLLVPGKVTARIANSMVINDLIRTELHWRKAGEPVFTILPMVSDSASHFKAEIPNSGENSTIDYYIKMVNSYYDWTTPQGAPENFYSYYIGADTIAPTFSHLPLESSFIEKNPRAVVVGVNDNIAIDTSTVYIHYTSKSKSDSIKLLAVENPEVFYGKLPPIFAYGDTVSYYFSCNDKAAKPNRGHSDVFSFIIGFEDFESGLNNWIISPDGWGLDMASPHSGIYTINDSPNQAPYPNNQDVSIAMKSGFDLSHTDHAALKFWTRVFLQINSDFGYVEASSDGGKIWNQIGDALNGFIGAWTQQTISLSSYCGPGNTDVRIRFRMISDANQAPPIPGWFIDDVQIIEGLDVTRVLEQRNAVVPSEYVLYQNHPNPFNPNTTIRFDLPALGEASIKIFNIKGEVVRTLFHSQMNAGSHAVQWDGKDDSGLSLASGLYFYQLSAHHFTATKKLLMIK